MSPASVEENRRSAVEVARRVIAGDLRIIEGCRQLTRLGHHVVENWMRDPDFVVFVGLESETDHLPLEEERADWNPASFEAQQAEVARFEEAARDEVMAACRSVIARFGAG